MHKTEKLHVTQLSQLSKVISVTVITMILTLISCCFHMCIIGSVLCLILHYILFLYTPGGYC